MDLYQDGMRIRVYRSGQALYGVANALYWKSSQRQIFTHLSVLKHQNTKTSQLELPKNNWVFALFEIFGPIRKRLQSTLINNHPVPIQRNTNVFVSQRQTKPALCENLKSFFPNVRKFWSICKDSIRYKNTYMPSNFCNCNMWVIIKTEREIESGRQKKHRRQRN